VQVSSHTAQAANERRRVTAGPASAGHRWAHVVFCYHSAASCVFARFQFVCSPQLVCNILLSFSFGARTKVKFFPFPRRNFVVIDSYSLSTARGPGRFYSHVVNRSGPVTAFRHPGFESAHWVGKLSPILPLFEGEPKLFGSSSVHWTVSDPTTRPPEGSPLGLPCRHVDFITRKSDPVLYSGDHLPIGARNQTSCPKSHPYRGLLNYSS
jgi:hypothetical protein